MPVVFEHTLLPPINLSVGTSLVPSASGSTIPSLTQLVDSLLNIWTVVSGVVYINNTATVSSQVILLLYYNNTIYQENINNNWWGWSGTAWVSVSGDPRAKLTASPNGSVLPSALTQIVDNSLNVWTLVGSTIDLNGTATSATTAILVLFYNGIMYYEATGNTWFSWNGTAWTAASGDPRSTPGNVFGIQVTNGFFTSTLNGSQINLVGSAMISTEESQGYAANTAGRVAGVAAVTSNNYTTAIAQWSNYLTGTHRVLGTINMIRVPMNSALWMGFTGRDPFGNAAGNYYSVGTDTNGNKIYSGGPGGGLGSGPGNETSGDPTAYRNYITQEVNNIIGAGLYVLLDLHWGTPTVVNTNQYVLPQGQPAMLGPGDVLFWNSIASTFGNQVNKNYQAVMFELFNEPFGTNIFSNQVGNEAAYQGSQTLTQFQFPTTATSPGGFNGGYGMTNNYVNKSPVQNILGGGAVCYAVGYQQVLNTIRGTGATNVICVGTQNFTGEPETWSYNGGQMTVNDPANNMAAAFHAYGYHGGTNNMVTLQNNGLGFLCTELGNPTTAGGTYASYTGYQSKGWGYTFWSWSNYGAAASAYSYMLANAPWAGNGQIQP